MLILAIAGTAACAYYDQYNNKLIPNPVIFGFLAMAALIALLTNFVGNFLWGLAVLLIFEVLRRQAHFGAAESLCFAAIAFLTNPNILLRTGMFAVVSFYYFAILAVKKPDLKEIVQTQHPFLPHLLAGLIWVLVMP